MKNRLVTTCLTGLAFSVAGLATAQDPVQIFNEQLTSHAAIAGAALSLTAGSMIGGDLAAGGAATLGAGSGHSTDESYQPNIYAGAAATLGASAIVNDIIAGGALTQGANAQAHNVSVGAAFTLGAGASVVPSTPDSFPEGNGAITTAQDMSKAVSQIHLAKDALYGLPTTSGADYQLATTLTGGSFAPGVYRGTAVTFAANSQIEFINDAGLTNPVWIFNLDAAMNAGAMSTFVAPDSGTVIWNVGGALTLGAGTDFSGVALVEGAVTAATSWVTCGNLYATAAVSIGSLNAAALDCSVSAQQSAGLTLNEQNEVLLDGNAINSDQPAVASCPYWTADELAEITDKQGYTYNSPYHGPEYSSYFSFIYSSDWKSVVYLSHKEYVDKNIESITYVQIGTTDWNTQVMTRYTDKNEAWASCFQTLLPFFGPGSDPFADI